MFAIIQSTSAQEVKTETMTIMRGETFEVFAVHDFLDPSFSWSLTKDGNLIQSSSQPIFRTRIREQGNYVLVASVYNSELTLSKQREFLIRSTETQAQTDSSTTNSLIESTSPRPKNGKVIFGDNTRLLRINPTEQEGVRLNVDANISIDDNGDGDTNNDSISDTLLFSSDNTPLFLWFTNPVKDQSIAVYNERTLEAEIVRITNLELAQLEAIEEEKRKKNNPEIVTTEFTKNTIGFGLEIDEYEWANRPLLLLWNFGDGMQSLLDRPIHTYNSTNDFDVQVTIRDLETNEQLKVFKKIITVTELETFTVPNASTGSTVSSASSQSSQVSSEQQSSVSSVPEKNDNTKTGGTLWLILKLLGVGIASVLAGLLIAVIIHFFKKKFNVQDILKKSEEKLIKTETPAENDEPAPMALPVIESQTEVVNSVPNTTVETPNSNSVSNDEVVAPSWLNQTTNDSNLDAVKSDTTPEATDTDRQDSNQVAENSTKAAMPEWLQPSVATSNTASASVEPSPINTTKEDDNNAVVEPKKEANTTNAKPLETQTTNNESTATKQSPTVSTQTSNKEGLPAWLQPQSTSNAEKSTNTVNEANNSTTNIDAKKNSPKQQEPTSSSDKQDNEDVIETDEDGKIPAEVWATLTSEQKEQEKKRQKRRRYRQNKKSREDETKPSTEEESKKQPVTQATKDGEQATSKDTAPKKPIANDTEQVTNPQTNTAATVNLPAWLQKGTQAAEAQPKDQSPVPPTSTEKDDAVANKTENRDVSSTPPAPSWLHAKNTQPTQEMETPIKESGKTEQATEKPAKESESPSKPKSTNTATPSWLQTGMQKAAAEGQNQNTPPPAELQDVPKKDDSDDDVQFIISADSLDDKS